MLSIISIMTGLAIPKYNSLKIRAARMEAQQNLTHIHTLLQVYRDENDKQAGVIEDYGVSDGSCIDASTGPTNTLGFSTTEPCKLRYLYSTGRVPGGSFGSVQVLGGSSGIALAEARENTSGNHPAGVGFGIRSSICGTNGLWDGYNDQLVVTNDRTIIHPFAGSDFEIFWDAMLQCK